MVEVLTPVPGLSLKYCPHFGDGHFGHRSFGLLFLVHIGLVAESQWRTVGILGQPPRLDSQPNMPIGRVEQWKVYVKRDLLRGADSAGQRLLKRRLFLQSRWEKGRQRKGWPLAWCERQRLFAASAGCRNGRVARSMRGNEETKSSRCQGNRRLARRPKLCLLAFTFLRRATSLTAAIGEAASVREGSSASETPGSRFGNRGRKPRG